MRELLVNEQITAKEVRLNHDSGTFGIVSLEEAVKKADEMSLDLVLISPTANPPVAKLMDYGKYRFDLLKKERDAKRKQKAIEVKEVQLGINIAENDMNVKAKNAKKFLLNGNKVKVTVRLLSRNIERGYDIMNRFAGIVSDVGEVTSKPIIAGRHIVMILSQKK